MIPFPEDQPGAYRWLYFDAVSPDGELAMVAIFFVGSVFSPFYASRLRRGERPSPRDHLAVNLALYRRGRRPVFAFSEYGRPSSGSTIEADASGGARRVTIARSEIVHEGGRIVVRIDERRVGLRTPVRGEATFEALEPSLGSFALATRHGWRAHVPRARVTARFGDFALDGALGYHDENWGLEPLARAFTRWSWGRVHEPDRTRIVFDLERRLEPRHAQTRRVEREHLTFDSRSALTRVALPARRFVPSVASYLLPLPESFDVGASEHARMVTRPSVILERSPFYLRFLAPFPPGGVLAMAEHIDFDRIEGSLVQKMIALRVARPESGYYGVLP